MEQYKRDLKSGDEGADVLALQNRLISLGFGKSFLKDGSIGRIVPEGYFGDVTEACLESFQAKVQDAVSGLFIPAYIRSEYSFSIDGVMNYSDWYLLENYEKLAAWYKVNVKPDEFIEPAMDPKPGTSIIEQAIAIAKSQLGVKEDPPYDNTGRQVEEYQFIGSCKQIGSGAPWCQYFMNWILKQLKADYKWTCSGYTPDCVNFAVKKNIGMKYVKPDGIAVGDFGYIYSASRNNARHVFLVIGKDKNNVTTIEGNTNPGGGSEGFGVFKRLRPLSQVWAVAKWYKLYE